MQMNLPRSLVRVSTSTELPSTLCTCSARASNGYPAGQIPTVGHCWGGHQMVRCQPWQPRLSGCQHCAHPTGEAHGMVVARPPWR
eukprot:scaffold176920_cov17-Tisochrysis_lutea.AAC.1